MRRSAFNWEIRAAVLLLAAISIVGCSSGDGKKTASIGAITMPKAYKGAPGVDPSVPAELGGAGFEKIAADSGWKSGGLTQDQIPLIGDPAAKKGGEFVSAIGDFPATFRTIGKDASTATNQTIVSLVYEPLIDVNPLTLDFVPRLASHWKIDPKDSQTYWFRINPNAHFSDGYPVTSEDVVASWKLGLDSSILDPFQNSFEQEFDMPVAVSKYIVKVRSKQNNWKNMLYFGGQLIYPAHVINGLSGSDFLKKFQWDMPPGSGPYVMRPEDLRKQRSIALTRLSDWWGKDEASNTGQYNFDKLKFLFIEDENLQYEKLLAGEIDWLNVTRSSAWVQKYNTDEVKRGLVRKVKIWNDKPQGIQGFAFNTRKPPFNDPLVRQAFVYLFDREELIQKLMFNERTIADSYYPNSPYENPHNPKYRYNPDKAAQLLAQAGYTTRNADGILVKNGVPFVFELPINKGDEIILTPVQQDLKKAGIKMNFRYVDFAQKVKLQDERNFTAAFQAYTGILYPNPGGTFDSKLADKPNNNNLTGFKNARADELIALEKVTADPQKRIPILQELDSILMVSNNYALTWYSPFERFAVWAYIGMPKFGIGRIADYRDVYARWWYDADKAAEVEKAKKDKSVKLEVPPVDNKFWPEWDRSHGKGGATASTEAGGNKNQ
jgi:microcin C transport system substrate-binding protein